MKKNIIILLILLISLGSSAQVAHEIIIQGGGGYSTLGYKPSVGKHSGGVGGECGLGYTCIFGDQWGIYTGIVTGFYNTIAKLDGGTIITPNLKDNEDDLFDMHTTFNQCKESQNAAFLNIPVMAQFQTKGARKFYALAGVKVGIPIGGNYKIKDADISNVGYYPELDNWLEFPEFAGFGNFKNKDSEGKFKSKATVMLALEAGGKWKVGNKVSLYVGTYFDYGLNNIVTQSDMPFLNYPPLSATNFSINTALPHITQKIHLMAAGVKLRITFVVKK